MHKIMAKAKILIVEDEAIVVEDIQKILTKADYGIFGSASSGEEALSIIKNSQPDLILMDIVLQGKMDGIQTAEKIRQNFDIPVVYLTAYTDEKTLHRAKITEPFGYIIKPFEDRELSTIIEIALYKYRMEKKLKASLKEKDMLLREIHHRVKNNMQVILSLLRLQPEYIRDEKYIKIFKDIQNRIKSMVLIHEKLYESKDLASINFSDYVRRLVNELFRSYGDNASKIHLKIDINDIILGIDSAIPCGLIINELVSNSLKYAFVKSKEGIIEISLRNINKIFIELVVKDNGVGLPKDFDLKQTKTLGLHLVLTLTKQINGEIELHRENGTTFSVKFKRSDYEET